MEILSLSSEDFRNLVAERVDFGSGLNLIVGENGQGKTNLLEGIAVVSGRTSFRGAEPSALRREGARACRLVARVGERVVREGGPPEREDGHLAAVLSEGAREHRWNGKRTTRLGAATRLPLVLLTGEDLHRLSGSPASRRRCVDRVAALVEPAHAANLRRYERARASKTRLLGSERLDRDELAGFDALLAETGAGLVRARRRVVALLDAELRRQAERLGSPYRELSLSLVTDAGPTGASGSADPDGRPSPNAAAGLEEVRDALRRRLDERRVDERRARRCLVGPHRDDVRLTAGGRGLADRASSGERRTLVLAWTLAEIHVIDRALRTAPVFAFDDFDSEWDERVLRTFASAVPPDLQSFLTSARPRMVRELPFSEGRLYTMAGGRLRLEGRAGRTPLAVAS